MPISQVGSACLAALLTITPYTPDHFLNLAKEQTALNDKVTLLRRMESSFPLARQTQQGRAQLVELLANSNRYEEALQEYEQTIPPNRPEDQVDFTLVDYSLRAGHYGDVLRLTSVPLSDRHDFERDMKLLEYRVQALLAQGHYSLARDSVDHWLALYEGDGIPGGRFEGDVRSMQFLRRHLNTLERTEGGSGKPLFTAAIPDSLRQWSHHQDVPIVFFKLIPAHPPGQMYDPVLPGRHAWDDYFSQQVDDLNRGFRYLSSGQFSLKFQGMHTLYVKQGDIDPISEGGHLLTSRVYMHTIPALYRLSGKAFVILVDYRVQSEQEASYMGDGLIHVSASKFQSMVLMHEILHGLGATHQEWAPLEQEGYRFDPDDRGLMTFDQGELKDFGLEEKNRAILGWPHVSNIHLSASSTALLNGTGRTLRPSS